VAGRETFVQSDGPDTSPNAGPESLVLPAMQMKGAFLFRARDGSDLRFLRVHKKPQAIVSIWQKSSKPSSTPNLPSAASCIRRSCKNAGMPIGCVAKASRSPCKAPNFLTSKRSPRVRGQLLSGAARCAPPGRQTVQALFPPC
jgi:hypothetical protein